MKTSIALTGSLREPDPNDPQTTVRVVYQRTAPGFGNIADDPSRSLQRRAHVIPADPKTPAQIARRNKMVDAVAAWHALAPKNRSDWTAPAAARNITPFNAFVSHFLRN